MVTIQQYQATLQQRRQQIESARQQVQTAKPQFSQQQLRQRSIQQRQRLVGQFERSKKEALERLGTEEGKQLSLEREFQPKLKAYEDAVAKAQAYASAKNMYDARQSIQFAETSLEKKYLKDFYKSESQARVTRIKEIDKLQKQFPGEEFIVDPKTLSIKGVESGAFQISLDIEKYGELLKAPSIKEQIFGKVEPTAMEQITQMSFDPTRLERVTKPTVVTAPTFIEKVRGVVKKATGISVPSLVQLKEVYGVKELKKVPRYAVAGLGIYEEAAEKGVKKIIPPTIEEFGIPERRFALKGTSILEPSGKLITPKPEIFEFEGAPKVKVVKSIAKEGGFLATLPLYATPLGVGAIAGGAIEGAGIYREPIPSVSAVIQQQTPDLSESERKEYLKTPEGKDYKKGVEGYISDLKRRKKAGLGMAILGGVALVAPTAIIGGRRLIRVGRRPFTIQVVAPPKKVFVAEAVTTGRVTTGIGKEAAILPIWEAKIPTYKTWISKMITGKIKVPETAFKFKPKAELTYRPFRIVDEKGVSLGVTKGVGERKTLMRLDTALETQRPTKVLDLSKLPSEYRFISRGLKPREVSKVTTFVTRGEVFKGIGEVAPKISVGKKAIIVDVPFRLQRFSKKQVQIFVPKERIEPRYVKGITRVERVGDLPVGKVFAVESAVKVTKKPVGIARGKVFIEKGLIAIREIPEKTAVEYIGKVPKQVQIKRQEQLVVKIKQLFPPKPIKAPRIKVEARGALETYMIAPRYVGGLGKGVSQYYGKGFGDVEVVPTTVAFVKPPTLDFVPLTPVRLVEEVKYFQGIGVAPVLMTGLREVSIMKPAFAPAVISRTVVALKPATKERVAFIVPSRARSQQVQAQRAIQRQAARPMIGRLTKPKPSPPPIFPPIISLPKDEFLKRRLRKKQRGEAWFLPEVRRFGKWFGLGRPTTRERAIRRGVSFVRTTLGASLRLRRKGELVPFIKLPKEFRFGRAGREPTILIQRAPRRLAARGEVMEIIRSRRAGAVKFL